MKLRLVIVFFLLALASRESIAASDSILVTVDTLCSSWHVCIRDGRVNGGIKSVILLKDTNGIIAQPPHISYNVMFDKSFDVVTKDRVDFYTNTNNICFDVIVDSISKNGYGALLIIDNQQRQLLVNLEFKEFGYKYENYTVIEDIGAPKIGTNLFYTQAFAFPASFKKTLLLESVGFTQNVNAFHIESFAPTEGNLIPAGSYVLVQLRVHLKDTGIFHDTLVCKTDCITIRKPFKIIGGCGIIYAHDTDVGEVVVGKEAEYFTRIENRGYSQLTILSGLIYSNGEISLKPFSAPTLTLPLTIQTNSSYYAKLTYKPTKLGIDSAIIVCRTWTSPVFMYTYFVARSCS